MTPARRPAGEKAAPVRTYMTHHMGMSLCAAVNALTGGAVWANGIRYLLMVLFSGIVWPLTFPFFQKLGRKD